MLGFYALLGASCLVIVYGLLRLWLGLRCCIVLGYCLGFVCVCMCVSVVHEFVCYCLLLVWVMMWASFGPSFVLLFSVRWYSGLDFDGHEFGLWFMVILCYAVAFVMAVLGVVVWGSCLFGVGASCGQDC